MGVKPIECINGIVKIFPSYENFTLITGEIIAEIITKNHTKGASLRNLFLAKSRVSVSFFIPRNMKNPASMKKNSTAIDHKLNYEDTSAVKSSNPAHLQIWWRTTIWTANKNLKKSTL